MKIRQHITAFREYFLILLPLFFVAHGYNLNRTVVIATDALELFLIYAITCIALTMLIFFIYKSWRRAALCTLFFMSFYFFFGAIHDTLKLLFGNSFLSRYSFVLPGIAVVIVLIFIYYYKSRKQFNRLTKYANLLLAVLMLIEILTWFTARFPKQSIEKVATLPICDTCTKPDIYLIVADEYAGSQELKDILHFDNDSFYTALKDRGFQVVDKTKSNYNSTPYSIASLFAMDYLYGNKGRAANKEDLNGCYNIINRNQFTASLKSNGYELFNHSIFRFDGKRPLVNSMFLTVGKDAISVHTLWGRFNRDLRFNFITRFYLISETKRFARREIRNNNLLIEQTEKAAKQPSVKPKFVYTHLMMPHFPYVLDKEGNLANLKTITAEDWSNQHAYLDYLQYSNKVFIGLIDTILKSSPKPPVIILMSDHGFRQFAYTPEQSHYVFMNLNAVYLPLKNSNRFYKGISNANQLSTLLNTLFLQKIKMKKDSSILLP